ncbi:MAG: hypothetical protein U5L95_00265 [Candidatus Saccharibacteria bacterium]|nr:hypothetical protein [Candidatus Saccharibacteria bacterium]
METKNWKQAGDRYFDMSKLLVDSDVQPGSSRLDAVRGDSEARTEPYESYGEGSTGDDDKVMRQETWRGSELGSETGQGGGGDW